MLSVEAVARPPWTMAEATSELVGWLDGCECAMNSKGTILSHFLSRN